MKDLLISIDQGGSKTEVIIFAPDGSILYRANDKQFRLELTNSFEANRWKLLGKLIENSLLSLNSSISNVCYVLAAVCGADWPEDVKEMKTAIALCSHIAEEKVFVVNDCSAAMRASKPLISNAQDSALLYAGTMFNCALESKKGFSFTYGRLINIEDHGAYAIGKQVWNNILDSYNGLQEPSIMINYLLEQYNVNSLSDICKKFTINKLDFQPTALTPILFKALENDDIIAKKIFTKFASRWADYAIQGAPRVGLSVNEEISLYLAGGIFKNCPLLWLEEIKKYLDSSKYTFNCSFAKYEPVFGAVILLLEYIYSNRIDNTVIENLLDSYNIIH